MDFEVPELEIDDCISGEESAAYDREDPPIGCWDSLPLYERI